MAFDPSTGEIILRAAQGLTQTLQVQAQLVQQQAANEQAMALKIQNAQAERDQAKIKADRLQQEVEFKEKEFQLKQKTEERRAKEGEARARLADARATSLQEEIKRGPASDKDLAFMQKLNLDRGVGKVYTDQIAAKGGEWGFGEQVITTRTGDQVKVDITKIFEAEGGEALLDRDRLWKRLDSTESQLSGFLQDNAALIGQKDPAGGESARSKAARQTVQTLESRSAAYRAGLRAMSDIELQFSPTQLRNRGSEGDALQQTMNELHGRRDQRADEYLKATGLGSGARLILEDTIQGLAGENRKTSVESLREHVRTQLGPTRHKAVHSSGFGSLVRYIYTYFPPEEADPMIEEVLAGLP